MAKLIYQFHPETGEYLGSREARLSPLDFAQGREVYLVPGNATLEPPPTEITNHVRKWTGSTWEQTRVYKISRTISKDIASFKLQEELKTAFPQETISIEGDPSTKGSKNIVFQGIPDTQENLEKLDQIIDSHVALDLSTKSLNKTQLAAFQVLCEQMRKINAAFPTFETFLQLVDEEIQK